MTQLDQTAKLRIFLRFKITRGWLRLLLLLLLLRIRHHST